MLTKEEFEVVYEFLDRVQLTGHNERNAMNAIIIKLNNAKEEGKKGRVKEMPEITE